MECISLRYVAKNDIHVPCGRCAFCLATARSDWALRLHYENRLHLDSSFVTLTYADPHLTWKNGVSQLVKSDLQKFFKRLRKAGYKLRYFAVGEYGSKTFRPHYHIILFGSVPETAIRAAWQFGLVHIGKVSQASVMYCLGYIVNGKGWKMRTNRQQPFATMSRGRGKIKGLGSNYLTPAMISWHKSDYKNYAILDGQKRHLPRYYKTKIFNKKQIRKIFYREQRASWERMVKWVRSPAMRRIKDPLAYRADQMRQAAKRINAKSKINLTI